MCVPRVSGRVQTQAPVKTAKNAASEVPINRDFGASLKPNAFWIGIVRKETASFSLTSRQCNHDHLQGRALISYRISLIQIAIGCCKMNKYMEFKSTGAIDQNFR